MTDRRSTSPVRLDVREGIATLTLNAPDSGNRIDAKLARSLQRACHRLASDHEVRAVVLTAEGDDFCLGGAPIDEAVRNFGLFRVAEPFGELPQPTLAVLSGRIHDQGLELALAADLRLSTPTARMAMQQITRGEFPFDGGTQRLPRAAGITLAMEMLLLGRAIDAHTAARSGLVNQVVSRNEIGVHATSLAKRIAELGAFASRHAKEALRSALDLPLPEGMRLEADLGLTLHGSEERERGLRSFKDRHDRKSDRPGTTRFAARASGKEESER